MISLFKAIMEAWKAGKVIANPAMWKSGGELTAAVTLFVSAVFTILLFVFPNIADYLTPRMATLIGTLLVALIGVVQIVVGRITTRKEVGVGVLIDNKEEPRVVGTVDPKSVKAE